MFSNYVLPNFVIDIFQQLEYIYSVDYLHRLTVVRNRYFSNCSIGPGADYT